jgi:hypothetical protein
MILNNVLHGHAGHTGMPVTLPRPYQNSTLFWPILAYCSSVECITALYTILGLFLLLSCTFARCALPYYTSYSVLQAKCSYYYMLSSLPSYYHYVP